MLRDVFYYGKKPNVHPREKFVKNLAEARKNSSTEHFWIINEYCEYSNFDWDFDFEFLPDEDVWAENHNNVWPSFHQKDSGTWLCPKKHSDVIVYRADVDAIKRKNQISDNWKILENIDYEKFDFSWHPDPTDPPYIYRWGCKYFPVEFKSCLEYHVPGATMVKYMTTIVELLPNWDNIVEVQQVDKSRFDLSWRPDPREPAYIYVWGNKYIDGTLRSTLEYHVPGATEKKYMPEMIPIIPEWDRWKIIQEVDKATFDFCWRPDPREPNLIYVFGNDQYEGNIMPTIEYHMEGATERKYINDKKFKAKLAPHPERFEHLEKAAGIDYSWVPDPTSPPYIYAWGNQWNNPEDKVSIQYVVEGATEYKYMTEKSTRKPCLDNWIVPDSVDTTGFDFSWEPSPADPPYIYEFGTQWQKTGGPRYIVEGATEVKYIDFQKARAMPSKLNWIIPKNIDVTGFDFSWHPDATSPPYIYNFATQWALTGGPIYTCPEATEVKYLDYPSAIALPNKDNWEVPDYIDAESFDFSWHPYIEDQPYIYQFGTQHQKTGGPRYVTPGVIPTSPTKYIDTRIIKSARKPDKTKFAILNNYKIKDFDYSWHPDDTEEPYIYVFGNNQYPAEIMPTIEYVVSGAKQIKYVTDLIATLDVDKVNWEIPDNIDVTNFDFSWKPNPKDPPYIYEFGTQWQKTGGPRYVVPSATEVKYVTTQRVKALPNKEKWELLKNIDVSDFDFSWHPDATSPPYIYHFATQWALSGGPIYRMPNATEVKYMEEPCAKALPSRENWEVPDDVDEAGFDFSWHPYIEDQPYIYQFGTQHQKTGGPRYVTPGVIASSAIKYIDTRILKAKKIPNRKNFAILNNYKIKDFDWSWHPDDTEEPYIYVFGNNQYPAEIMPTVEYKMQGAKEIKYVHDVIATLADDKVNWEIPDKIDVTDFDFSWKPNPKDPPYIYQFGTQHQKTGGPRYIVPDASQVKYVEGNKAKALPNRDNWIMPVDLIIEEFDYSWHPDTTEDAYIYVFPTQWQLTGGPKYIVEGATEFKFMDSPCAIVGPNAKNWEVPSGIKIDHFDFSWHPHPDDPVFIYQFSTQWQLTGGPRYIAPGAIAGDSPIKYIDARVIKATVGQTKKNWEIPTDIVLKDFDFSWHPHPDDPTFIYQFGTQHQKTGGPRYLASGAVHGVTPVKYIDTRITKAIVGPNKKNWEIPAGVDLAKFDFSWHPDDTEPPYIYQFGTLLDDSNGPRYVSTNSNMKVVHKLRVEIEEVEEVVETKIRAVNFVEFPKYYVTTTVESLVKEHPEEMFWALNNNLDYSEFDFTWTPSIEQSKYIHAFGSADSEMTQTYLVNAPMWLAGHREINWVENKRLDDKSLFKMFKKPNVFLVDRGNPEAAHRFAALKQRFPDIQKTRYLNSWVDTINRCINRASSNLCWILNSELDYTKFDFNYYPNPWQMKMVHVFGTQWSHWGTTFMINRETFASDTKYIKIIEHLSNLNFVKDRIAIASNIVHDIIYIDHGNVDDETTEKLEGEGKTVFKYDTDYLTTFKHILSKLPEKKEHYVWITSSVCDYKDFDFSYICDPFSRDQLHVFPSDRQQFGDTFFVNVNRLRELVNQMPTLKDYEKINYNQHQRASRLASPVIVTEFDSHVASVMEDFNFPYATFVTSDNKDIIVIDEEPMSLWDQESKNVLITSTGGTRIVVPKEAKEYVETQLYDYPYIKTASRLAKSNPLDIVFLSNGELCAEENYEHLLKITKGLDNRIVRVDGVNGRAQAYHAAAEASNTSWMFTVFAKLKVNAKFDFNWQPDRLQIPKHYMFLAKNPVNGLIYGHQGMIAYNKQMTLDNEGHGLDFTLDSPHETIELLSGIATYNTDEWSTWRTAFREVIKLKKENSEISLKRLDAWLNKADGSFAEYSLDGARHGIEYFEEVDGKTDMLRLSYEWKWLRQRFDEKYKK